VRVEDIPGEAAQADDNHAEPSQAAPGIIDELVAWNIRQRRQELGLSQAELAEKMAALGWKYHPQTVHRIESGQRKVTIGEAGALARIFGVTVDALTWPDTVTHTAAWFGVFTERADAAFEQIAAQTRELLLNRERIERGLAEVEKRGIADRDDVRKVIADARSVLDDASPEQAVEAGRGEHEERSPGTEGDPWESAGWDRPPRAPWLEEPDVES
jgi:transcriptional regulator with XRE-family HTH domain